MLAGAVLLTPVMLPKQEMTPTIYTLMSRAGWWQQYMASPPSQEPYFTALLYKKAAVSSASDFTLHYFENSIMGAMHPCTSVCVILAVIPSIFQHRSCDCPCMM